MFKSFALALLAATTYAIDDSPLRGDNDGANQENALYTSFINSDTCGNGKYVKLDMWTYIAKVPNEDAYEYHGDTVAFIEGPLGKFIQYGFCIHIATSEAGVKTWDCQQVDVTVPINNDLDTNDYKTQTESNQFTGVTDWQYTGARNDFTWAKVKAQGTSTLASDKVADAAGALTESAKTTADHNWQISAGKSFTNCGGASTVIKCPRPAASASLEDRMKGGINLHWFRNFTTGDAAGYDIQLDGAVDAGVGKETFAFLWSWNAEASYPNSAPWKECLNSQATQPYNTTPVTSAAWTKVYVEPAPVVPVVPVTPTTTDTNEDHSIMTTASATALLSAVYALAF